MRELENLYVIKIGGNVIDDDAQLKSFIESFVGLKGKKILVHGGGKLASRMAEKSGITQQLVEGRRITDAETLKIVTMVYAGYINKNIVAQLQAAGTNAIGLTGADANIIKAHKRTGSHIDYGYVGDVDNVNAEFIKQLLENNIIPVLCSITHDGQGQLLNTNADSIAQETARAMSTHYQASLVYTFEKAGVLIDAEDERTVIPVIDRSSYAELKEKNIVFAGMIPKLDNAFKALESGVHKVYIGKATDLQQLVSGKNGTVLIND